MSRKDKIRLLEQARTQFCGVGTRTTKLRLNKLAKSGDTTAAALRTALELEDANITAKKYHGGDIGGHTYDEINYFRKADLIDQLVGHCKALGWTYGIQPSQGRETSHVIYFEIPGGGQISYHVSPKVPEELPVYSGHWDGQEGSALPNLEKAISRVIGGELGLATVAAKSRKTGIWYGGIELTETERVSTLAALGGRLPGLTPGSNRHRGTLDAIARLSDAVQAAQSARTRPIRPRTEEDLRREFEWAMYHE